MQWIKDIVNGLVEQYQTNNIYELCDFLNIEITRKSHNKDIKSYFFRNLYGDEYIFLNSTIEPREEKALIAHELGHAILHTDVNVSYYCKNTLINKGKLEKQADYFAAILLTANIEVDNYSWEGQTICQLADEIEVEEFIVRENLNLF